MLIRRGADNTIILLHCIILDAYELTNVSHAICMYSIAIELNLSGESSSRSIPTLATGAIY